MPETNPDLELARTSLKDPRYPRTCGYDPDWLVSLEYGCPTFWLLESLCGAMDLKPGMRVLDLGCGKAGGSIFLAREYGVHVWAADLWVGPCENWERIRQFGLEDRVFPLRAEAHELPFADGFFDALVAVNSLQFFATDDLYLKWHLIRLVKPGGQFGIVAPGFYTEIGRDYPNNIPEYLRKHWDQGTLIGWHTAQWWREHWLKTGKVEIMLADNFPDGEGYQTYLRWERIMRYERKVAEDDSGRNITFVRLVARRTA
jgi:SAM-dependent methyltransferase